MKLQVNSDHKKYSYNSKGRKIFIKLGSIFCGVSLFSGVIASALQYKLSEETLIPITDDARNSIYQEEDNEYFYNLSSDTQNSMDYNITDKTVYNIKTLDIDMKKNNNLKYISNFPNLTKIKISNAQMLSDVDLITINNSNLQDIEFVIDMDDIEKNNKAMPNFNFLVNKSATVNPSKKLVDEVEEFKFYNLIFDYLPKIKNYDLDYNKYFQIDNKLNEIMSKVNIDEYSSNEERVMKIIFSVLNFIDYDKDIKDEVNRTNSTGDDMSKEISDKTWYYGDYLLSAPLLNEESYSEGTCKNFSALFEAICAKLGIEAHMVGGIKLYSPKYGHEWNYVKIDDTYYLVDLVAIYNSCTEKNNIYNKYFNKYMVDQQIGVDDKEIMNEFIDRVFDYYSDYMYENYYSTEDDGDMLAPFDDTKNVEYINRSGEDIKIHDIDYILSTLVGSISGMAAVIPAALLLSKKRTK